MRLTRATRSAGKGFTLIEVLLVVVLIGVLMGIAVISLNPGDPARRLLRERERLQGQLQYARLLAESDQIEIGLRLHPQGYEFLRFSQRERRWLPLNDDPALKPGKLPGIDLRWRDATATAMAPAAMPAGGQDRADGRSLLPDLLLLSSGEATPGVISLLSLDDPRVTPLELGITDLGDASPVEEAAHARR